MHRLSRLITALFILALLGLAGCETTSPSSSRIEAPGPTDAPIVASIHSQIGRAAYSKLYAEDPMVRDFIRSKGEPEYVLIINRRRVKLIYWERNFIVYFGNTWFQSETGRIHHDPRIPEEIRTKILALNTVAQR